MKKKKGAQKKENGDLLKYHLEDPYKDKVTHIPREARSDSLKKKRKSYRDRTVSALVGVKG